MRLHRLAVTAFGPFSGTEEIDFDALSGAGLFLINGPTGAGKTSVLDAICFALFGQVPGARNAVKALRSDHAAPELAPRVRLEATIRGRLLRITRSPAWERPKRRGTGTTTQQASVIVEERTGGGWIGLTTRLDEAGNLIGSLLGMTVTQFCQVAMLPQGEFAAFLRSGAEERRKVLEKLFATEVFTRVETWLADHRAQTRRVADELRAAAESTADRIAETAGVERPGALGVPQPRASEPTGAVDELASYELLVPWTTELAAHLTDARDTALALRDETATALEAARSVAQTGRALAERQRRHADALHRRATLDERADERARLTAELAAAQRADRVLPLLRGSAEREKAAETAHRKALAARTATGDLVPGAAPEDVLSKAERDRRDEVAALEQLRADEARAARLDQDRTAHQARLAGLAEREAELARQVAQLPGAVEESRTELEAVRIRVAARPGAVAAVEEAARRLDAARRRDTLTGVLAEAQEGHRAAVDTAQEARGRLQELRQARLEGMAAVLAGELVDGQACRVCGSTAHPAPAVSPGRVPGDADEKRAERADARAQTVREQTATRVGEVRAELESVREQVGDRPVVALATELTAAEAELDDIDAIAGGAARLEADLERGETGLARARDGREGVVRARAEGQARLAELTVEAQRLRTRLDEARGTDATLEARIGRLAEEAAALHAAAAARSAAETAAAELVRARSAAEDAAAAEGFGSAAEVAAAALSAQARSELSGRIRGFDDEEAAVRELLADPSLAASADAPAPDLAALEQTLRAAEELHTAVTGGCERARRRSARLAELSAVLFGQVAAWRPAAERQAVAARLAGLASGQSVMNRLSMRLSAYVLAARLERVVAAANERLARMSAGRYALVHTTEKAAGDRRGGSGGLGLRVIDGWTGRQRDPVTLSGGESFVTSLSLALGLADVVTGEAGGTEIGTLFVDEGFGTLDEDTLDEVMDVLDGLRDGGRAVGIVSHVAELRTRIPAQLRVHKGRAGSRVTVMG
jgi:DNA repair protein SbcC/Rad50